MGDKELAQIITETERQKKEKQEYLVQYVCLNCNYEWSKYWSYAHNSEDCPKCDVKSIQGVFEEIKREGKDIGKDIIKLFELNIIIRADSINNIIGLIPRATGEFLRGNKIGSWCGAASNYEFRLNEK